MADEKQLTVAELLARNAKEHAGAESEGGSRRRRRRRSLEDGGVSVAELTGNLEKVTATPAQSKHSSVSIDETAPVIPAPKQEEDSKKAEAPESDKVKDAKTESAFQPSTEDTHVIKRVDEKSAPKQSAAAGAGVAAAAAGAGAAAKSDAAESGVAKSGVAKGGVAKGDAEKEDKAEATLAEKESDAKLDDALTPPTDGATEASVSVKASEKELDKKDQTDVVETEEDFEEEDEKLNPFSVLLLALIGIVLGAVVFKGFEILWDSFSRSVVAILAIAVTALMAALVHVLRTNRDGISMTLAAFVGLVLTFGPLLIVM
ncbi:chromate transporter [Corynebacterium striatum]|uniref:chromate transporter n=1 Tax=Corynebacterium striatum TaxID=43770 RepID=UPI00141914D8|nr:chromate transporter [Corynebacterium striatum]NHY10983.1 chromate transporter [Corynebacterium striatum]NHY35882.1 chromate transporter [Corynebacterium striatum]HAT1131863.1 chromate transporter [Corynebacterium striatum]HAT1139818.1 chromate transporter [Corynebacterium striatum]HAT1142160.1 chromate transporter [Corynebacterium striatum]